MTDERKQAEEYLTKTFADKKLGLDLFMCARYDHDYVVEAIATYAALKVAEATKEMYPKEFIEWCIENVESTPIRYRLKNGRIFLNISELFEYWKQNIRK